MSQKVFFIVQGQVEVMNKSCQFKFCTLEEGSVFGDISLLLNIPNYFSYFFNPLKSKTLILLEILQKDFVSICQNF
jgi:hypothetical protein